MKTVISLKGLKSLVRTGVERETPDVRDIEIDAFVSGIFSSVGIMVANEAMELKRATGMCPAIQILRMPLGGLFGFTFVFERLSRSDLIKQLEACSGLPLKTCEAGLESIENVIAKRLEEGDEFEIERFGIIQRKDGTVWGSLDRVTELVLGSELVIADCR